MAREPEPIFPKVSRNRAVIGGVFCGIALGLFLAILVMWICHQVERMCS